MKGGIDGIQPKWKELARFSWPRESMFFLYYTRGIKCRRAKNILICIVVNFNPQKHIEWYTITKIMVNDFSVFIMGYYEINHFLLVDRLSQLRCDLFQRSGAAATGADASGGGFPTKQRFEERPEWTQSLLRLGNSPRFWAVPRRHGDLFHVFGKQFLGISWQLSGSCWSMFAVLAMGRF